MPGCGPASSVRKRWLCPLGGLAAASVAMLAPTAYAAPSAHATARDRDGDGLSNRFERKRSHTNPRKKDTDSDGLSDRFELRRSHTNPRKKDTDGDGYPDGLEVFLGSDPRDPRSIPVIPAPGPPASASPLPPLGAPSCVAGSTSVTTAAQVRAAAAAGQNVCVIANVGDVNLSSLSPA